MAEASIALNRFGMGGRPGDDPGHAPGKWLLAQFDRYEPSPGPVTALSDSAAIVADLHAYQQEARAERRTRKAGQRALGEPAMSPVSAAELRVDDPMRDGRRLARRKLRDHYAAAVSARARIAIQSPAPFIERLVHFWANHFAVSADKVTTVGLAGALEFEAIRPHVLGKFGDMLHAVEHHPAMLLYLDQAQSVGPGSPAGLRAQGRFRKLGLNENLAREILELHTLGVRTGYTQADVTEFARAMTGWTVSGLGQGAGGPAGQVGRFRFVPRLHEPGSRTILGKTWPQAGEGQAAAVLDLLATHPATARHVATKLARHFAGDEPPSALVGRLETAFLTSGGDLPTVYRALVAAPECWVVGPVKFKSPWEWTISAHRALGTRELPPMAASGLLVQLGQPVWRPGSPAGWDDVAATWAGPDAVMRRVEAAERLAQRTRDTIDARARAAELFPAALSPATMQALSRAESPGQALAMMLVAPEFMRR